MQGFELVIYTKANGETPVDDFVYALPEKLHAKALKEMKTLKEYGNALREPYTKYIGDGVFELRIKVGTDLARILYFYTEGRKIIVTNGFMKKTEKTPLSEILKAKKYRDDYCRRERKNREI